MIVQINYDDTHPILTGEDGVPVEDQEKAARTLLVRALTGLRLHMRVPAAAGTEFLEFLEATGDEEIQFWSNFEVEDPEDPQIVEEIYELVKEAYEVMNP